MGVGYDKFPVPEVLHSQIPARPKRLFVIDGTSHCPLLEILQLDMKGNGLTRISFLFFVGFIRLHGCNFLQ
jgi:hypothetical protein